MRKNYMQDFRTYTKAKRRGDVLIKDLAESRAAWHRNCMPLPRLTARQDRRTGRGDSSIAGR
jgi:hypothetical protein